MRKSLILMAGVGICIAVSGATLAGGDAAAGKTKSASCGGCHGANGEGVAPNPALKGKDAAYIVEQLKAYKSGARPHDMMKMMVQALSDQDMEDLGAYYASMK